MDDRYMTLEEARASAWDGRPQEAPPSRGIDLMKWRASSFSGKPSPVRRLVADSIPLAVPSLIAAQGDVGKSTLILDLGCRTAFGEKRGARPIFGGNVVHEGAVVILVAEDGRDTVHRRLDALDPDNARFTAKGDRLIVVPLPEEGGPSALVVETKGGFQVTEFYRRLEDQLRSIPDLALVVFDPLQTFIHAKINEDPAAGQFVCSQLAGLAAQTKASVIAPHHMRKSGGTNRITTLAEARDAVRGTSALIDGVRLGYAMWPVADDEGKKVCRELQIPWEPNKVVRGGVIKANEYARRTISTYVRNDFGLLVDAGDRLMEAAAPQDDHINALVDAVRVAALRGQPFTKTGKNGLHEQRARLPESLRGVGKHKLAELADKALEQSVIKQAMADGSKTIHWLDVPDGPFARGEGTFVKGAAS